MTSDSADLLQRIRNGDEGPLRDIYRTCRRPFVAWITRDFPCTPVEAIEFFQTAVVIFYDNIITGKLTTLDGQVLSYLFAIGRNKAHEWLRHRQRQDFDKSDLVLAHLQEEAPDTDEEDYARQLTTIHQGLEKLGDPCRSLLQNFYYLQWTMRDICERMGYKNEDTVKNVKYKCLQRLQKLCADLQAQIPG